MAKSLKISLVYEPLEVSSRVEAANGVAASQTHNSDLDAYLPDYTITPLLLAPVVDVVNTSPVPGDPMPTGNYNAASKLASVKWEESSDGENWATITPLTQGYSVNPDGSPYGSLLVKKNSDPRAPLLLRFSCALPDRRQPGVSHKVDHVVPIRCVSSAEFPTLELDAPDWTFYHPARSQRYREVKASLKIGGKPAGDGLYAMRWLAMGSGGAWHLLGSEVMDYWVREIDGGVEVDMLAMGKEGRLRVEAAYDPYGNPQLPAIGEAELYAECSFKYRWPRVEWHMQQMRQAVAAGTQSLSPVAVAVDGKGIIESPESYFDIRWLLAKGTSSGSDQAAALVGRGPRPVIPLASLSSYGGTLTLAPVDLGGYSAWADSDGKLLTDNDGAILLIK